MKVKFGTWGVSVLAAAIVAVPAIGAFAAVIPVVGRVGSLVEVGPISADNGFPVWYRDSNGATPPATSRLEMCMPVAPLLADRFCAPPILPNPAAPMVYPTNYPNEIFYQMANNTVVAPGLNLLVEMNVEGAYATGPAIPGDEMVFSRIRMRDKNMADGTTVRVTHPYGVDEFTTSGGNGINMTQDIGATPGAFGNVLGGRIGPFLKWDATAPTAPVGYTGDPAIKHTVVGSPYGTNFIKVEKLVGATWTTIAQTNLFSVQGRYATNSGVDVARATYSAPLVGPASVDVFATSEVGQSIQVTAKPELGLLDTTLRGEQGRYFGRLPLTVAPAPLTTVDVVNAGDKPVTKKTIPLTDLVTIASATYTGGDVGATDPSNTLVVTASSSDAVNPPVLTVTGFTPPLVAGTGRFSVIAPPSTVTVTSSRGGSATIQTSVAGAPLNGALPIAAFTAPLSASIGVPLTLDAAPSTGGPLTYAWAQLAGTGAIIPVMDMTTPTLTFTPTTAGTYNMQLVVTGPAPGNLVSVPTSHTITVTPPPAAVTAAAGPDQTIQRGQPVTLDASLTTGAASLSWVQASGPAVTLSSTTASKPTFVYSLMPLPNAAVGSANVGYVANNAPLVFTLTATAADGTTTSTDQVTINPAVETLAGIIARYRTRGDWRVTGTSSILAAQRVTAVVGSDPTGMTIGSATVDPTHTIFIRGLAQPDPQVPLPAATQVTLVSATGGVFSFALSITP